MKRRNFILLSGGTLAAVAIPVANYFFGKVDYPRVLALPVSLTPIMDLKELKELGLAYRSLMPGESGERTVAKRLMEKFPTEDEAFTTSLESVIKRDFADGETIEVGGWILSRTEARQCALFSFFPNVFPIIFMHTDARKIENHSVIEGDVCIVGAGAAGISMALDWIGSKYKVILLESGGFEYDDKVQDFYKGKSTGQKYYPLRASRLSYFGGTTGHWAGMCSPFDEIDFMKRDWVPNSGWPITRKELDPFYARANEKLKLGPYRYDLDYWQKEKPNLIPFPLDQNVVWHKMWQISPTGGMFDGGGFNKFYKDDIVKSKNIQLYTYATVVNVVANENVSSIREVQIKNQDGKSHVVKAKYFILAGGAIQNARILLASNAQAKQGLGNDHDVVGRYFMEHLEIQTAELWLLKPFDTALFTRGKLWCELAITAKAQQENKILSGTAGPKPLAESRLTMPRMEAWQNEDPRKSRDNMIKNRVDAGQAAKKGNTGAIANAYEFQTRMEQAPNRDSRITIGPEKDELGVPLANLHWQLTELDKRSVRRINQLIGWEVGKAGFGRVKLKDHFRDDDDQRWPEGTNAGWHHMGTTRMGTDLRKSVVNSDCQVHGIDNLYVAGAGCYATAGAPNPTLTLIALSLRLSDYVKGRLEST